KQAAAVVRKRNEIVRCMPNQCDTLLQAQLLDERHQSHSRQLGANANEAMWQAPLTYQSAIGLQQCRYVAALDRLADVQNEGHVFAKHAPAKVRKSLRLIDGPEVRRVNSHRDDMDFRWRYAIELHHVPLAVL